MKKELTKKQENIISWSVVTAVAVAFFCGVFFGKANYTLYGWEEALFIPGIIIVLLGFLVLVTNLGAFDMFSYGFRSVFFHMNPNQNKVPKYKDYPDFVNSKRAERQYNRPYLWPYFVIGGVMALAGVVLMIVLNLSA